VAAGPETPVLPCPVVAHGKRDLTVDGRPVDVDPIRRRVERMFDGVHERFRDRGQDREGLVVGRPLLGQPATEVSAKSGGTLGPCPKVKLERSGFSGSHHAL
jgi:hypothetical protein